MIKKIILVMSLVMLSFAAKSEDSHGHDHDDEPKKENPEKDKTLKAVEAKEKADDGHGHDEPHSDHGDEHDDEHAKGHHDEHSKDEHAKGHSDQGGEDEHGHGDENAQIGADKGILEADKDKGFKLSPEAEANFKVEKIKVQSSDGVEIPKKALVTSTIEVNVYRYRDGFYKRIDFDTISKNTTNLKIKSKDIKQGDEIATTGLGFLRVTEIAAFDGAPEGHAH
jgi:hypothetical protein